MCRLDLACRPRYEARMQTLSSILDVADRYDGFILDLWGVIHDGQSLYPGVRESFTRLKEQKKQVILLSNAPRRAARAQETLAALGIAHTVYDHLITSGEAVYGYLNEHKEFGPNYYYIGPDKDLDILDGLKRYSRSGLATSQFILNVGFFRDEDPIEEYETTLQSAKMLNLPMICANPDRIVVRRSGEVLPCAGLLAERYTELGGQVLWFGKPYREVYHLCLKRFVDVPPERILAVGDNLDTDILGANQSGITSVLVTGGILKEKLQTKKGLNEHALMELITETGARPDYLLEGFGVS